MNNKLRIAIVVSHPIQHFCPQYVSFTENKDIEFKVFFASALGYKSYVDINFKMEIAWGNLDLDKFDHTFLNGDAVIQPGKELDAPSLENELNIYKPAVLFSYGYFQKFQRRAYNWAIRNKVKIAYISDSELRHAANHFQEFLKSFFLRRYFSKINYFLTMGNANEAYYKKYGIPVEKMIRMHYPIDFAQYKNTYLQKKMLRNTTRQRYSIPENEIALAVVGKLVPWKNQDHIIDALQLLEPQGIYAHLFILGSGEMKASWEQKAKQLKHSKVYFTGFVTIEELPAYYAASDIYIHPASMEPHSVAISEAIQMGCPVILSSRCGSYGEDDDVQEGKNGFVYEFGNIAELAAKIKLLVEDKKTREEFGRYSHEIAVAFQNNSHYVIIEKLIERMNLVVNCKKPVTHS
jgi:glycosyltransferase involved in cell wall biosynthesis